MKTFLSTLLKFMHSSELSNEIKSINESIPSKTPTSTGPRKITLEFACCDPYSNPQEQVAMESQEMEKVERVDGLFCGGSEAGFVPRHQQIVNLIHSKVHYSL
jgi:hypothetical protein